MKKHYQRHDVQFKRQAVKLANHPEIRTQDVAAALGIHPFMLSRWKKELRDGKVLMDKPRKQLRAATVEEADARIRELERELAQLREENDLLKKLGPSGSPRRRKSSPSSRSTGGRFKVTWLCQYMKVSTSGYYAWRDRAQSTRAQQDLELVTAIKRVHRGDKRCYGSPRVHRELRNEGYGCGRHRVARLMRVNSIVANRTERYRNRGARDDLYARFDNLLLRRAAASRPDELWVGDYTYLRTQQGWLYLAVVLDLYARRVIGWSFSSQRTAQLPREALRMALDERKPAPGTLFHSDQGVEYAAHAFQSLLTVYGLEPSMSRKGNCYDNAFIESFFASLKLEIGGGFRSAAEAIENTRSYIHFYNHERQHSSLGYQSPVQYERLST